MPIVASANSATYDDVFIIPSAPPAPAVTSSVQNIGVVGTYNWGPVGVPVLTTSPNAQYQAFGTTGSGLTGIIESVPLFANGTTNVWNVRVTDGTDTYAAADILDATTTTLIAAVAQAAFTGSYGNAIQVIVQPGQIPGTNNVTVQRGTRSESYQNVCMSSSPPSGAQNLVQASQNAQLVRFQYPTLQPPNEPGTDSTASTGGSIPNEKIYCKQTWTTATGETTASAEFVIDLSGSTTQTNEITYMPPVAPSFATGYKLYISTTSGQEALAAVSNSPTASVTVSALPVTGAPQPPTTNTATYAVSDALQTGTYTLSGGTDGVANITAADYYGVVTSTGQKTGLQAFANLGPGNGRLSGVFLAGQSDATTMLEAFNWGQAHNIFVHGSVPKGTPISSYASLTNPAGGPINNQFGAYHGNWQQVTDPFTGQLVWVSPASFAAAMQGSRQAWNSIANVQIQGSMGCELNLSPEDDYTNIQYARVNVIGPIPAGGIGFATQLNLSLNQAENLITDTLTQVYIAYGELAALGWAVERRMTSAFMRRVTQSISAFLDSLVAQEVVGDVLGQQQPYLVVCDSTNNTDDNIQQGILNISQTILLIPHARKLLITSQVGRTGTTVTVQQQPA